MCLPLSRFLNRLRTCLTVMVAMSSCFIANQTVALDFDPLSNGYSNCSYRDNGNGTSTITVTIDWKEAKGHIGRHSFRSRGVLLYTYDANGKLNSSSRAATSLTLDGVPGSDYSQDTYTIYYSYSNSVWRTAAPVVATVVAIIKNNSVAQWPAIGVRAGNFTNDTDYAEVNGLAYIAPSNKGGECRTLIDPGVPPPPEDVLINMEAPDWDLGELVRGGVTHKSFSSLKDQLCFTYKGNNSITYQEYVIDASNRNGLSVNGKYQLKHQDAQAPGLPYQLTLNESANNVVLPNPSRRVFKLNNNGKTCFMPTFDVSTDKNAKGGIYSDVLTFTITAKS
ncbi:MAG: hypothetical protein ACN6QY_11060 [Pseudomonas sp.]|uniref:hypothetical protein n=1 Tax=Pseudomonas sp. TaxID=306 RepID=UPI003D0E7FFD